MYSLLRPRQQQQDARSGSGLGVPELDPNAHPRIPFGHPENSAELMGVGWRWNGPSREGLGAAMVMFDWGVEVVFSQVGMSVYFKGMIPRYDNE